MLSKYLVGDVVDGNRPLTFGRRFMAREQACHDDPSPLRRRASNIIATWLAIRKQHAFKLHTGKLTKLCPCGQQRCSIILLDRLVWGVSTRMGGWIGFVESDCWRDLLLRGVVQGAQ